MKIENLQELKNLDVAYVPELSFEGIEYKRIEIVGENSINFYNDTEQHLIELKQPDKVIVSYCILNQNGNGDYFR